MNDFINTLEMKRLVKISTFAVTLLALFLLTQVLVGFKDWRAPSVAYSTIVVSGEGEVFATPDIASFSFSVSTDNDSVSVAQDGVTKKADAILALLKNLGIDDKDVRTTDYSVYPKYLYQHNSQIPDGYTVSHAITVKIRKTENAGKAIAIVGDNGATNVSSLNFSVDDPNAVQAQARDKAVADAKTKAMALAKSLGVSLGRIVDFSDSSGTPIPGPIYSMASMGGMDAKSVPNLPMGQNKITDRVSITYEIR